jgi:hypothetical protein
MNEPIVKPVTIPTIHKKINTTAADHNMESPFLIAHNHHCRITHCKIGH